jgi:hypothetical protein
MITLATPSTVPTTLGGTGKTNYDRLDITTLMFDVVNKTVSGQCQLLSSADPQAAPISGSYNIPTTGTAPLNVAIPSLGFFASLTPTTAQQATVQSWIQAAQTQVEAGLVALAVVAGVQSPGL